MALLLLGFDRGVLAKEKNEKGEVVDVIRTEIVHCRIWLSDSADLDEFLKQHRPYMPNGPAIGKPVKWLEYMTATKKELGL